MSADSCLEHIKTLQMGLHYFNVSLHACAPEARFKQAAKTSDRLFDYSLAACHLGISGKKIESILGFTPKRARKAETSGFSPAICRILLARLILEQRRMLRGKT